MCYLRKMRVIFSGNISNDWRFPGNYFSTVIFGWHSPVFRNVYNDKTLGYDYTANHFPTTGWPMPSKSTKHFWKWSLLLTLVLGRVQCKTQQFVILELGWVCLLLQSFAESRHNGNITSLWFTGIKSESSTRKSCIEHTGSDYIKKIVKTECYLAKS